MPYKLARNNKLAKMSVHEIFGLSGRQASGYAPSQTFCNGSGDTCETACGAGSEQCPSTDGGTHCFVPGNGQLCCPDGTGNACDSGYFCTTNSDGTWCCPNGLSLTDCAALYGVSSLTSEAPASTIPTPAVTGSTTTPASESATLTPVIPLPTTTYATASSKIPTYTPQNNGTVTTSSPPVQITGAANHLAMGALPALALAAGAVLAL